jgi:GTP-binding protein
VNNELAMWDASLAKRPQVVVVNKTDLPDVKARLAQIKEAFREADIDPIFISAVTGSGLKELINETWKLLKVSDIRAGVAVPAPPKVFRPQSVEGSAGIQKSGGTFIVADPELEHLLDRIDLSRPEEQEEFKKSLEKLGINKLLKSAGAKSGDRILSGKKEWQWYYTDEHRRSGRNV